MRIAIHQPEHMPWGGFFHKMANVDLYVILDCVQYTKNNWQNRNQFSTPRGDVFWLTAPVKIKGHLSKTIRDMEIDYSNNWIDKYWETLKMNYSRASFFADYAPKIKEVLELNPIFLWELNIAFIHLFRECLGIFNGMIFASELDLKGNKSGLLLDICKKVGATTYLSGQGGRHYLDLNLFSEHEIVVEFDHFQPEELILNKSIGFSFAHTLFNLGAESKKFIVNNEKHKVFAYDKK